MMLILWWHYQLWCWFYGDIINYDVDYGDIINYDVDYGDIINYDVYGEIIKYDVDYDDIINYDVDSMVTLSIIISFVIATITLTYFTFSYFVTPSNIPIT